MSEHGDWIRLNATPGVGCVTARKLLSAFGLPCHIVAASHSRLCEVVPDRIARALCDEPDQALHASIAKAAAWCEHPGNHLLTLNHPDYPPRLLEIPDPPIILYLKGRLELIRANRHAIAVVGSRNATRQGMINAEQFSASLSQSDVTIVSGLALGIDTAAHQGGLQGSGSTIAVIGTGADIVYPARNHALAHQIAQAGCIVSEHPLGTPAIATNFPRRNRLISGLSRGVLVIEAAAQSGSLITARIAAEQGRDVFAIPGSIHSPLAKGCHDLLRQGAQLVETAEDILSVFSGMRANKPNATTATQQLPLVTHPAPAHNPEEASLLEAMGFDPIHPDVLAQRCNIEISDIMNRLLTIELNGQISTTTGGRYQRLSS